MATAYATIAAHGLRCYPKPVLSVTGRRQAGGLHRRRAVPAGAQARRSPTPSPTCWRASSVRHRRQQRADRPTGGRQDRHDRRATTTPGSSATSRSWPRRSGSATRAAPRVPAAGTATTPDGVVTNGSRVAAGHAVFGGDLPTKIWAQPCAPLRPTCRWRSSRRPTSRPSIGITASVPNVAGYDLATATNTLTAAGFTPVGAAAFQWQYTRHGRLHLARRRVQAPQGSQVTIFTSTGAAPVATKPPTSQADHQGQDSGHQTHGDEAEGGRAQALGPTPRSWLLGDLVDGSERAVDQVRGKSGADRRGLESAALRPRRAAGVERALDRRRHQAGDIAAGVERSIAVAGPVARARRRR